MNPRRLASSIFAFVLVSLAAIVADADPGPAPAAVELAAAKANPNDSEINVNLFRNPSIGLEVRQGFLSVHAGLYPTIISKDDAGVNETTWFVRAGVSAYFLGASFYGQRPSELYASASYTRGLTQDRENGLLLDVGYRWMVWRGLNVRLGVAALLEPGHDVKINPTPGIGWSTSL